MNQLKGSCHCGAIQYSTDEKSFDGDYCHCRDCQKITGSPISAWMDFKVEKHEDSFIKNILGISLCATLTVFALTKAPESIANETINKNEVSFNFKEIPLKSILMLITDAMNKEIVGFNKLPNIKTSVYATHVDGKQLEGLILKCTGYKLENKGSYYEIMKDKQTRHNINNSNQCINTIIRS